MTGRIRGSLNEPDSKKSRLTKGDLLGGIAASAVALPQSMGLGVALFLSMGFDASAGALAGLVGAAALSLFSGLTGATVGMISAPNGPVTTLLSVTLVTLGAQGMQGDAMLLALVAIMFLTGLLQFLLGITGGGQLIKFIPYPVVAGLVSGIGVLMIMSQLQALSGEEMKALGAGWMAVPAVTALVTLGASVLVPRIAPSFPPIIAGLVAGVAVFHLAMIVAPAPAPESWLVGAIPSFDTIPLDIDASQLFSLPWHVILVSALTLSVLASVDCLLTAVVADDKTGARHNADRELAAQGIGQAVAGLLGGIGGGGTKASTLVAIKTGGRRWAAVVSALIFILLILFLRPVGNALPISALAAVIIYVGIDLVEWNILHWLRKSATRLDGVVALMVIATTLAFNLIAGVVVGVVGAVLLFVRRQVIAPIIHERVTGKERHSLCYRTEKERRLLDEHGDRIVYIELRGNLFFGTVDRLFAELIPDLNQPVWMILNMRRVQSMDMSGLNLFKQMIKRLDAHGGQMLYSNVRRSGVMERKMHKLLRWLEPEAELPKVKTFKSTDAALEFAENELLTRLGCAPASTAQRVELEQSEIFQHLRPKTRAAIKAVMRPLSLRRKQIVYAYEEFGDALYFILQGEVEIRLPTRVYHYKRLAKLGPGSFFGEDAFLEPAARTSTAFVTRDAELLMLDRECIESLEEKVQREVRWPVLNEVAHSLARQLRWTQLELRRLERW